MILLSRQHWDELKTHLCWSMSLRHRLYLILFFVIISFFISPIYSYSSSFSYSPDDCPANLSAGTFTIPRLYFDLMGNVAGQHDYTLEVQGTEPAASIGSLDYRYYIVDGTGEIISVVINENAESGTSTEVDFTDVGEDNYAVYGVIYEDDNINYVFPRAGDSIEGLLDDIDNCNLCAAYSIGAIATDICVPEMTGNTPILDGEVESIYASMGRYPFAAPMGYGISEMTSDERGEEGSNIIRINNGDVPLEGGRTGDIQDFYVTYDANYVYLSVVGVNGFTVDPDRSLTDQLDLFIAIDTDNDIGNSLSTNVAPLNKGVDFYNWLPDHFVVIDRVETENDLAELYRVENGGSTLIQSDTDRNNLTPNSISFDFGYADKVIEVRIPWGDIGLPADPSVGATWNFAVYTTYEDETYDAFDVAPQTNSGEVLPDRPEDIDYCDTDDPVTSNPDSNCEDCAEPDGLGPGSPGCGTMSSPASDNSENDFDTIEEYFQIRNIGQFTEICCQAPLILNQPDDNRSCIGEEVRFVVVATANVATYQWQIKAPTSNDFMDLVETDLYSGTTTAELVIEDNSNLEGYEYQVIITEMGGCSTRSDVVMINVNAVPEITMNPVKTGSCEEETVTFSGEATGNNLVYHWEVSKNDGNSWEEVPDAAPYSGVLTTTLTIVNNNELNGNLYRLRVIEDSDLDPNCTVYTEAAALRVGGEAEIIEEPIDVQPCAGGEALFKITAIGESLSYRWQFSSDGGMTWENVVDDEIYVGAQLDRLLIMDVTDLENYKYRVVINSTVENIDCPTISEEVVLFKPIVAVTGCNDDLNISLGASCEVLITPDIILEGDVGFDIFKVVLTDLDGNEIPNPLTSEYLCETIKATVIDNCTGSNCWTLINVENKSKPFILAPQDIKDQIGCENIDVTRLYPISTLTQNSPVITQENCEVNRPTVEYSEIIDDGCPEFRVDVTWTVTDKCGNSNSDIQRIFFRRPPVVIPNVDTLILCGTYDGSENACRPFLDYNENGIYNTNIDKYLNEEDGFCQYGAVKEKEEFDLCANGMKKIIRWRVYDWCNPQNEVKPHPKLGIQENPSFCVIKSEDRGDPRFNCLNSSSVGGENNPIQLPISIKGDQATCSSTADLTFPATDACNAAITYRLLDVYRRTKTTIPYEYELVSPIDYNLTGANPKTSPNFSIAGLECDIYYAEVQAEDECNHVTGKTDEDTSVIDAPNCRQYFEIVDDVFPVAVCDDDKSISFTINCSSTVPADVFDGGSIDNCFLAEKPFTVARASDDDDDDGLPETADFKPTITFGANDLVTSQCSTDGVELILRVEDAKGNFGYCSVNVELEDRIKPTCVGNSITRPCTELAYLFDEETTEEELEAALNASGLGMPGGDDNCGREVMVVDQTITKAETKCGAGTIRRRYRVEDVCGNKSEYCTQVLTVSSRSNWRMDFPLDALVECETEGDIPRPLEIEEILTNNGCDQWAMFVEEEIFEREEDACYKMIREYRFINWCTYTNTTDPYEFPRSNSLILTGNGPALLHTSNAHNNAFIIYRQIIKVTQSTVPGIVVVHNTKCDDDDDCEEEQLFTVFPINPCSPLDNIGYYFVEDTDGDGMPDTSYENEADTDPYGSITEEEENPKVAGRYPIGAHKMVFFVEDVCGGTAVEEVDFTVEDCTVPTMDCILGLEVELRSSGMSVLRASEFNGASTDGCSGPITFAFSDNPADSLRQYTCNDIDRNISIDLYAFDTAGNVDVCSTTLVIRPNEQTGCTNGTSTVAGAIRTEVGGDLDNVSITLNGSSEASLTTSVEGLFTFRDVPPGGDYTITPNKDENHKNGISTFDLVLIRKHVLNLTPFDSPYKIIAADANNSKSVTTFDLVILRKLILGIEEVLPATTSWRFIDKEYQFPDPRNPWLETFPEVININNLPEGILEARFTALKVGDVNYSATPNEFQTIDERTFANTFYLDVNDYTYEAGQNFTVDLNSTQLSDIAGCQFALAFDPQEISFLDLTEQVSQTEHWNIDQSGSGWLTMSWDGDVETATLASLNFKALRSGQLSDVLEIAPQKLIPEAYSKELTERWSIALNYNMTTANQERLQLLQNVPNPFQESTAIRFFLPEASSIHLEIRNIAGQVIYQYEEHLGAGYQELILKDTDVPSAGVLYYQLTTNTEQAMRKMVKVN